MRLRTRVRLLVVSSTIAAALASFAVSYWSHKRELMESLTDEAKVGARGLAGHINPVAFARLSQSLAADSPEMKELQLAASAFVLEYTGMFNPIVNAYGLVPTKNASSTGVDLLFEASPRGAADWVPPGTPYNLKSDPTRRIDALSPVQSTGLYDDAWGLWVSGFAPLTDQQGRVIGAVGVDINYAQAVKQLQEAGLWLSAAAIGFGLAVGALGDRMVGLALKPVEEARRFIARVRAGENPPMQPTERAPGELAALWADLHDMAASVFERKALAERTTVLQATASAAQHRLAALGDIAQDVQATQDVDILLDRVLALARQLLGADCAAIHIREGEGLTLLALQCPSLEARWGSPLRFPLETSRIRVDSGSFVGHVAMTGGSIVEADAHHIGESAPYRYRGMFDQVFGYQTRAIICTPLATPGGGVTGVLQVSNPSDAAGEPRQFSAEEVALVEQLAALTSTALERARLTRSVLGRMVQMSEIHDPSETAAHVQRVAGYSVVLYRGWAQRKGIPEGEVRRSCDLLRIAALVHDVGKVGIPDRILKFAGRLSPEDYATMKWHTVLGAKLFTPAQTRFDSAAVDVVMHHHERWDGTGYPGQVDLSAVGRTLDSVQHSGLTFPALSGAEIPIFARVVAVADVFDALGSARQYKTPWPEELVLQSMREGSGTHFDPELIEVLLERIEEIRAVGRRFHATLGRGAATEAPQSLTISSSEVRA